MVFALKMWSRGVGTGAAERSFRGEGRVMGDGHASLSVDERAAVRQGNGRLRCGLYGMRRLLRLAVEASTGKRDYCVSRIGMAKTPVCPPCSPRFCATKRPCLPPLLGSPR